MSEHDVQVVFSGLLDRAFQLFSGLRELPPFGSRWQQHFNRTFESFTRLW